MVVSAHLLPPLAGIRSFGVTGVDLFFVLSGYVFAPYMAGKPLALRSHLVRRFFRLYPLYAVAVGTYAGIRWLNGQPADHLTEHLLLAHTLESRAIALHLNPAFWSLPPEVEFYLVLPLLARWVQNLRRLVLLWFLALAVHLTISTNQPPTEVEDGVWLVLSVHRERPALPS